MQRRFSVAGDDGRDGRLPVRFWRDGADPLVEDEKVLAAGLRNGLEADGFALDVALRRHDGL